jgi:hypothetical protein
VALNLQQQQQKEQQPFEAQAAEVASNSLPHAAHCTAPSAYAAGTINTKPPADPHHNITKHIRYDKGNEPICSTTKASTAAPGPAAAIC